MDTQNPTERPAAESVVRLADYRPPAWRVTEVQLKFDLGVEETLVHSKLTLARDRDEPLRLDGEDVELRAARLDGRALVPADYTLDVAGLTIPGARDAACWSWRCVSTQPATASCAGCTRRARRNADSCSPSAK